MIRQPVSILLTHSARFISSRLCDLRWCRLESEVSLVGVGAVLARFSSGVSRIRLTYDPRSAFSFLTDEPGSGSWPTPAPLPLRTDFIEIRDYRVPMQKLKREFCFSFPKIDDRLLCARTRALNGTKNILETIIYC